jgi:hypothetical protein
MHHFEGEAGVKHPFKKKKKFPKAWIIVFANKRNDFIGEDTHPCNRH